MRPSHFTYVAPSSVAEVCAELASFGSDARLIAGGAYKRRVATTLVRRTLERAFADLMKGKQL